MFVSQASAIRHAIALNNYGVALLSQRQYSESVKAIQSSVKVLKWIFGVASPLSESDEPYASREEILNLMDHAYRQCSRSYCDSTAMALDREVTSLPSNSLSASTRNNGDIHSPAPKRQKVWDSRFYPSGFQETTSSLEVCVLAGDYNRHNANHFLPSTIEILNDERCNGMPKKKILYPVRIDEMGLSMEEGSRCFLELHVAIVFYNCAVAHAACHHTSSHQSQQKQESGRESSSLDLSLSLLELAHDVLESVYHRQVYVALSACTEAPDYYVVRTIATLISLVLGTRYRWLAAEEERESRLWSRQGNLTAASLWWRQHDRFRSSERRGQILNRLYELETVVHTLDRVYSYWNQARYSAPAA